MYTNKQETAVLLFLTASLATSINLPGRTRFDSATGPLSCRCGKYLSHHCEGSHEDHNNLSSGTFCYHGERERRLVERHHWPESHIVPWSGQRETLFHFIVFFKVYIKIKICFLWSRNKITSNQNNWMFLWVRKETPDQTKLKRSII